MYGKAILIIFLVLFLLYLWNKITEFVDNTDEIKFTLYENMFHDQIHLSVATILTKTRIDNNINSADSIQRRADPPHTWEMMEIVNLSEYKALNYNSEDPDPSYIDPYFTYNSGEITIGNVIYVSSVLDTSPYYCKDNDDVKDRSIDNFYYFTYSATDADAPHPKLFTTRIAILLKVNEQYQLKSDQDFSNHVSGAKVVKLGHINDNKYNILSLEENETDNDISGYLNGIGANENIIMYIYEGLDIDEDEFPLEDLDEGPAAGAATAAVDVSDKLMNIKCEDIYKSFGKRHNNTISTNTFDNYPNWTHNFIIKHISENIGYKDIHKNNILLKLLIGNYMPSRTDDDWQIIEEILASKKFKNHIEAMKINIVNFHNHIDKNGNDNILAYIILDITELDDINTLTSDDIRSMFITLFTGSTTKSSPVHQTMETGIDNIQELIYLFNFEDKRFIRLPYFLHMCSQDSELIGILQTLIIKKDPNDNKMYISYADVCRRNNDAEIFISNVPTNPINSSRAKRIDGGDTYAAIANRIWV